MFLEPWLDFYGPVSLSRILELKSLEESTDVIPPGLNMISNLAGDNYIYLATLYKIYDEAEQAAEFGISNKLQDIISDHEKHAWMLRSFTR